MFCACSNFVSLMGSFSRLANSDRAATRTGGVVELISVRADGCHAPHRECATLNSIAAGKFRKLERNSPKIEGGYFSL